MRSLHFRHYLSYLVHLAMNFPPLRHMISHRLFFHIPEKQHLGAGHILVQRYGDILDGKRTWQKELSRSNLRPSLPDAVAGDITSAMPYRAMVNIINFIQAVDHVVPGFAAVETLLYSPELKFYSNRVKMDTDLNTSIHNLHCLGDASGWTRGLMMASCMGVLMGRKLAEQENA